MTLTRRTFLHASAGAGLGLTIGWWPVAVGQDDLIRRVIPSSGEAVPVVGIGTNRYRTGPEEIIAPLRDTLRTFVELGGRVIDTAPSYRTSEAVLGRLIEELGARDRLFLATKVDQEGTEEGIARMEASLDALRTDRVDLMQVHNLRDAATQLATMRDWKAAGRIRYVGITTSSDRQYEQLERILTDQTLDFVQVDYSLNNRSAAQRILPLARDRGAAVLVNLPFGRALLFEAVTGRPVPEWASELDASTWGQVFLKYILGNPAVTAVIPGTRRVEHVVDNMGAARGRLPDPAMLRRIEAFFDEI
jgi:aryl-alcohol dehydrogenase-like predicted oxidoreductase